MKKNLFSGMQPSGELHIGNYLGAIKQWIELLDKYNCIFCVVDLHAITIQYDTNLMQPRILRAATEYIASGVDPEKCTIFVQSDVPEHTELAWIFNTITPIGELNRMTQFKDKSKQHNENINMGLMDYPVLQAADVLLYKGVAVPIGEDQAQHIELTRTVARKFNNIFGDCFPEPKSIISHIGRLIGTDGENKMSKSIGNHVPLTATDDEAWKIISRAFTDPQRLRKNDPGRPEVCNIYTWHKHFTDEETVKQIDSDCRGANIGCVDCKKKVCENILKVISPIREKAEELLKTPDYVMDVLDEGAKKLKPIAEETMNEVREMMGLVRKRS